MDLRDVAGIVDRAVDGGASMFGDDLAVRLGHELEMFLFVALDVYLIPHHGDIFRVELFADHPTFCEHFDLKAAAFVGDEFSHSLE